MRLVTIFLTFFMIGCLAPGASNAAGAGDNKPLTVIDGQEYSSEEYEHWWEYWRETETQQPESVNPYIEWCLMVREAERMELSTVPEFIHKIEVFLKARTLMALKHNEIDLKVSVSEDDVQSAYELDYSPRRLVGVLEFESLELAEKFMAQFGGQSMPLDRLQKIADQKAEPAFVLQQPQWLRPLNTPPQWLPLLAKTGSSGMFFGPLPLAQKTAILYMVEVKPAAPDDFAKKKEEIKRALSKKQEQALTDSLILDLMKKYQVRVDQQVLKEIDLANPGGNDLQKVVIDSDRSKVTVGYFLEQCRKESDITRKPLGDLESQMRIKQQIANTMIGNSVVSWEALARHYEEKPPLQWAYQFYRQNRLVAELENRALGELQTSDNEAQAYYQEHQNDFQHDEVVQAIVLNGEAQAVKKVWTEALVGADLLKAAKEHTVQVVRESSAEGPTQQLSAPVREVLARLQPGDVSQPFLDNGQSALVKLVARRPGGLATFAQVEKAVKEKIMRDKKAKQKKELLETLKSRSTIMVHDDVWAALQQKYRK